LNRTRNNTLKRGVVYIVYGDIDKYLKEACESAKSLKRHHPDYPVALVSPEPHRMFDIYIEKDLPTEVKRSKYRIEETFAAKTNLIHLSPFEKTLFLDTDTTIVGDLSYGFRLLSEHDIVLPIGGIQCVGMLSERSPGIPLDPCDIWFNSGVIYFNKVPDLFAQWKLLLAHYTTEIALNIVVRKFSCGILNAFYAPRGENMFSSEHSKIWHNRSPVPTKGRGDELKASLRELPIDRDCPKAISDTLRKDN